MSSKQRNHEKKEEWVGCAYANSGESADMLKDRPHALQAYRKRKAELEQAHDEREAEREHLRSLGVLFSD